MGNVYAGLLHYPVRNAQGKIVATALTGLDLHDIARSARTFELARYYVITPLATQRAIARQMMAYWERPAAQPANRAEALQNVGVVATLEDSLDDVKSRETERPLLVATSARAVSISRIGYDALRRQIERSPRPVYLLFGTGWGIADELLPKCDAALPPILGPGAFNHLSVRAAAAIIFDRLRGRREE